MENNTRLIDITWGELCALLEKRDAALMSTIAEMVTNPSPVEKDPYISDESAAEMLGINKWTLHNKANKGQIPFYKVGGKMMFKESEIHAFINDCRIASGKEIQNQASKFAKTQN